MTLDAHAIASLVVALVVGLVGFLLRRAIGGVDSSVGRLDGKVDTLAQQNTELMVGMAELRVRVAHLERENEGQGRHVEDISGFLSTQGFRKRGPARHESGG